MNKYIEQLVTIAEINSKLSTGNFSYSYALGYFQGAMSSLMDNLELSSEQKMKLVEFINEYNKDLLDKLRNEY